MQISWLLSYELRHTKTTRRPKELKTAYTLKTSHVVFLPVMFLSFFFGRSIGFQESMECDNERLEVMG